MMAVNVNKIKNEQCTGEIPIRTTRRLRRAVAESSLKRYCTLLFAKFSRKIYQTLVQFARKIACSEQHITLNSGRYQQHISRKALNKILIRVKFKIYGVLLIQLDFYITNNDKGKPRRKKPPHNYQTFKRIYTPHGNCSFVRQNDILKSLVKKKFFIYDTYEKLDKVCQFALYCSYPLGVYQITLTYFPVFSCFILSRSHLNFVLEFLVVLL